MSITGSSRYLSKADFPIVALPPAFCDMKAQNPCKTERNQLSDLNKGNLFNIQTLIKTVSKKLTSYPGKVVCAGFDLEAPTMFFFVFFL